MRSEKRLPELGIQKTCIPQFEFSPNSLSQIIPRPPSDMHNLGGQDTRNLPKLFDDVFRHRMIHEKKRQRFASFVFSAQMHACNIDVRSAKNATNGADNSGFIVVREEDHV